MPEKFIDDLYNELHQQRQQHRADNAKKNQAWGNAMAARQAWFGAFVERVGQLVGAWNEKALPGARIEFHKRADGHLYVHHDKAEAELWLENDAVYGTRTVGNASRGRESLVPLPVDPNGNLIADKPGPQAERFMRPVFEAAFNGLEGDSL